MSQIQLLGKKHGEQMNLASQISYNVNTFAFESLTGAVKDCCFGEAIMLHLHASICTRTVLCRN